MRSKIGDRLDPYQATLLPRNVCGWCRHPVALHRGGRECQADRCRCPRTASTTVTTYYRPR